MPLTLGKDATDNAVIYPIQIPPLLQFLRGNSFTSFTFSFSNIEIPLIS